MNKANFVIGALVLTFGSMAIADKIASAPVAQAAVVMTDAADTFVSNAPKGWLVCKGLDSDNVTTLMKVKLSNVTNRGMVLSTRTLDNQNNEDILLSRKDNDPELITFGDVQTIKGSKVVTNLVTYGTMKETMLATSVYAADNSIWTFRFQMGDCVKAK